MERDEAVWTEVRQWVWSIAGKAVHEYPKGLERYVGELIVSSGGSLKPRGLAVRACEEFFPEEYAAWQQMRRKALEIEARNR